MQKLRITNLPRWISEIHIKQFFNSCGKIVQANVELDHNTLRPLGHGFITFADDASTERALEKNGALLDGVAINVQIDADIAETVDVV
ncbi:MAG TPA: RNA-binding protein [Gammaproteobacteria bacterium]|nr:RNA-binding protein [Gammaproteobacteria bacterium]